ncbi:MAG: hypothetical protein ACK565_13930, partial [Pirellulaceae bacterium]
PACNRMERLVVVCSRSDRSGHDVLWPFSDLGRKKFRVPRPAYTPYGACLQSNGATGCGLFAVGSQWP